MRQDREPILEFKDVTYSYDRKKQALSNVNVRIGAGEKIAVLGNNGAGKSTFFLCANGICTPQSGGVYLYGEKMTGRRAQQKRLRQQVGIVFQEPEHQILAPTVRAEISFGPMNLGLPQAEVVRRVDEAVMRMKLEELCDSAPHYLSGGEKKRVCIADILAMEPALMLLDEPEASLDPQNTALLEKNLHMLAARGISLVVATHDIDFAWRFAQRIFVFHAGRLIADGTPEQIFADTGMLEKSGLGKPLLYEVGERLRIYPLPKTVNDLQGI